MKTTIPDETSPLLPAQPAEDPACHKTKPITPLPKLQLGCELCLDKISDCSRAYAVIACIRLAEPIAYTQIFPYINEFLSGLHVTDDPKRIGFYSGLVVCLIHDPLPQIS